MIIQDGTEFADYQASKEVPLRLDAWQGPPVTARELLAELAPFHLGQRTLRELEQLVELLRHRRAGELVRPVRYGLLLQCESDDYALAFLRSLSELLERSGLLDEPPALITEAAYNFSEQDEAPAARQPSVLRVVYGCQPAPRVKGMGASSEQDNAAWKLQMWEEFWENEEGILRENPNLVGVAVVSRAAVHSGWKQHEHLFYRVYGHHIFLDDLPADDIRDMVFKQLDSLGLERDGAFAQALGMYIRTVYPKADLKFEEFVSDLVDRILTAYYSVPCLEKQLTVRCVPYYSRPRSYEDVISKLDGLVGMENVKESFQELYYQNQDRKGSSTPLRLSMAFVGNPGTGKTTVARMTADLLYAMGLIRKNKLVAAKPADLISPWVGQTAIQTRDICRSAYDGVLFIDEAYTLAYSPENRGLSGTDRSMAQCVDTLLQEMEENADRLVVIFAGYPGPINRFLDSNEGLRSRVTRIIQFPDYTEAELLEIFQRICAKERFSLEENAFQALKARIAFEKAGENFGNARSVETIFQSIRAEWHKAPNEGRVFTQAHIQATMPEQRRSDISSMIGLDEIKEQLRLFENRVKYLHALKEKGVQSPPMNLHMLFIGNPGTGKTTVAQVIAEDLYRIGILKTNKCVCVEARDLLGNWTAAAKRTEKEIQRAMGGVLFLDEAYALTEYASGSAGREAIATLITAMEKYRGELLVILAGYPRNMRAFLNVNPGLASRIGHTFHFRDYTVQELTDIFLTKMQKSGYLLSDGVAERVNQIMEFFHVIPGFGNGRFVDNVIDHTITCRSMRSENDPFCYNDITAADIPSVKMLLDRMPDGDRFRDPAKVTREEKRRTAVHEVGHALASLLLEPETKLLTISIADQAFSSGRVGTRRSCSNPTEEQMMNTISIALGGRDAERVVFGTHSTGCASDYTMAKAVAGDMLELYAMGAKLGDSDIAPLLNQADQAVMKLLTEHKDTLMALADQLLEQQELTEEQLRQYLAQHPAER